jgi:hypothetical protein
MNGSRGMISLGRRHRVFQAPNPKLATGAFERAVIRILRLEVSLDVVSLELGIYEIVLAGETGAVFLFVV